MRQNTNQIKQMKKPAKDMIDVRDEEVQTEDFNFIEYNSLTIQNAEIYMFDRVSKKMRKMVVEEEAPNVKVIKQYEYNFKGMKDDLFMQIRGNSLKKLEAEFKYKVDIKNSHYEINRSNRTLRSVMERLKELEGEVQLLEKKKEIYEGLEINDKEVVMVALDQNNSWKNGFS